MAQSGLVQAKWTQAIHDEWMQNVSKNNPALSMERLTRTRALMDAAVRDCLVVGYEDLIESLSVPDPEDRHVLAVAICADADVIVTFNLSDFPTASLQRHGVTALHPDEFVATLIDVAPVVVASAVRRQREGLKNPPKTIEELLETLRRCGLARSAERLRSFGDAL